MSNEVITLLEKAIKEKIQFFNFFVVKPAKAKAFSMIGMFAVVGVVALIIAFVVLHHLLADLVERGSLAP